MTPSPAVTQSTLPTEAADLERLREDIRRIYSGSFGKLTADERLYLQSAMCHLTTVACLMQGKGSSLRRAAC